MIARTGGTSPFSWVELIKDFPEDADSKSNHLFSNLGGISFSDYPE
jgi:hypothetical protein